jgi:transcription initiation factor TFIIE subunit alpha
VEERHVNNGSSVLGDSEAQQFLQEILGDEGMDVVSYLMDQEATDEELSEQIGIKLNIVRKVLYRLYDYRLASYTRTKDKTIGWYIYTWKLDLQRIYDILTERKQRILDELTKKLEFETTNIFFCCKSDNYKVPFDLASEYGFKCPQCQGEMEHLDNQNIVVSLEEEINRLRKEIGNV